MGFGNLPSDRLCRRSLFLCALLLSQMIAVPLRAQRESAPPFHLVVLEGDGALNSIRNRTAQDVVLRVEDERNRPVSGVPVTFQLPEFGPSARFSDGSAIKIVTTDSEGQAKTNRLQPNNVQGEFQIQVSASYLGSTARTTITQTNVIALEASSGGPSPKWLILLAVAGGAGAALALAKGGGDNGSSRPAQAAAITIIPGTPVVTGPR